MICKFLKRALSVLFFIVHSVPFIAQNVWFETSSKEDGGFILDTTSFYLFDPYSFTSKDSTVINWGDGVTESISAQNFTVVHPYPNSGIYIKSIEDSGLFNVIGKNITNDDSIFYTRQVISYNPFPPFYFHNSPRFDLGYKLTRCATAPFYVNPLLYELNGDSMTFLLNDRFGELSLPNGVKMDSLSGELSWASTVDTGIYHFSFITEEYRNSFYKLGTHSTLFMIEVTDNCPSLLANDSIDQQNLFHSKGREFRIQENTSWNYSFTVDNDQWDSIKIVPSSELLHNFFSCSYTVDQLNDRTELTIQWPTNSNFIRNHPFIVTYHVTAYKNGQVFHRVLTNTVYVEPNLSATNPNQLNNQVLLFPNPSSGNVSLVTRLNVERIELYNTLGVLIYQKNVDQQINPSLNLQSLRSGTYLMQIQTSKGIIIKKLTIQ